MSLEGFVSAWPVVAMPPIRFPSLPLVPAACDVVSRLWVRRWSGWCGRGSGGQRCRHGSLLCPLEGVGPFTCCTLTYKVGLTVPENGMEGEGTQVLYQLHGL